MEVCLAVQEAYRVDHGIWMIGAKAVPGSLANDEREIVHWLLTLNSDTIDTKEITRLAKCQEREDSKNSSVGHYCFG